MLLYLDLAYDEMKPHNREELREAIYHGAVKRVRPKVMTVACAFFGLVPIMWSTGAGADVMKRIAAPMIGGLFTSFLMELLVYPAIYYRWKWREVSTSRRGRRARRNRNQQHAAPRACGEGGLNETTADHHGNRSRARRLLQTDTDEHAIWIKRDDVRDDGHNRLAQPGEEHG